MAKNRRSDKRRQAYAPLNVENLTFGMRRTEVKRGASWVVQPISAQNAVKTYICPGCSGEIEPGIAHLAAWREDGILGDAADLADRRHWHEHCWKVS